MWPINYILLFVAFIIISCELRSSIAFDEPENCKQLKFDFNDFLLDYVKCCQSMCQVKFGVDAVAGVPYFYKAGLSPRFKGADTKLDYMACDTADDRRSCGHIGWNKTGVVEQIYFGEGPHYFKHGTNVRCNFLVIVFLFALRFMV